MTEENCPSPTDSTQPISEVSERLKVLESKIDRLVPHVLQLENAAVFIVGLIILLQVLETLRATQPDAEITKIYWFVPYALLFLVSRVIKVMNFYNRFLDVVETGFRYTGTGALVGGSITGLASGGLGAPVGAAIGGGVAFITGVGVGIFKTVKKEPEPERKTCHNCSRELESTDKYCQGCGKSQTPVSSKCSKCSTTINGHARFCPKCGASQTASDSQSQEL